MLAVNRIPSNTKSETTLTMHITIRRSWHSQHCKKHAGTAFCASWRWPFNILTPKLMSCQGSLWIISMSSLLRFWDIVWKKKQTDKTPLKTLLLWLPSSWVSMISFNPISRKEEHRLDQNCSVHSPVVYISKLNNAHINIHSYKWGQ